MGYGEAGSEGGVVLDAYFHVLPGMQEQDVDAMDDVLMGGCRIGVKSPVPSPDLHV